MSGNACETARHRDMPADCAVPKHAHCELCSRCYVCGAEATRDTTLTRIVSEWERNNPMAYGREE